MLTIWMTDRGYTVPDDRYGLDQPGPVDVLYRDHYEWLRHSVTLSEVSNHAL
jgi:hypothetical protein